MGKIEEKIKNDLMQDIFSDTYKIYQFIEGRFKLEEKEKQAVITKLNNLNNELTIFLKEKKLS